MARWGRWRDREFAEHYWLANDMSESGAVPAVLVEIVRRLNEQGKVGTFLDLLNHRIRPSQLLTPARLLGATARVMTNERGRRRAILREVGDLLGREARRRWLNHRPAYAASEQPVAGTTAGCMTPVQRVRRTTAMLLWRVMNPLARRLAGIAPFWVVLETTGRRTGKPHQTPLARGPQQDGTTWLIAVHGRHSAWVKNVEARPDVRIRIRGRWMAGTATVLPWDEAIARRFNRYGRLGPTTLGIDPALVRVDLR
jgi:deazaflavin-dependent oxidoreductase (nitroreductase family)